MKNNKGFTLIELMIAVAIIGILAIVLIPRVAGLKDDAKEQGLSANIRSGIALSETLLENVEAVADDAGAAWVEGQLATKLPQDARNPFTKKEGVQEIGGAALAVGTSKAYAYDIEGTSPDYTDENIDQLAAPTEDEAQAGVVIFDAYVDNGKLKVKFVPFDRDGAPITGQIATTN